MVNNRLKKQKILGIILGFIFASPMFACTTFVIKDSTNLVFGRNFDWDLGKAYIVINNRGLAKESYVMPPYKPAKWISKYGSITFNQIGIDAPMGGMNEMGLVIAQMGLFETKYPEINGENVVNGLEWIQYQLDNSTKLDDVIINSKNIHINPNQVVPVHYFICDQNGNMGIIEFLNGEIKIIKDQDIKVPVCSNMPYEQSLLSMDKYKNFNGDLDVPKKWNSVSDIVAIANQMISNYPPASKPVDYSFKILDAVGSNSRTQWSIVFDLNKRIINYKTLNNKTVRVLNLDDFNFSCENEILIMDVQKSTEEKVLPEAFSKLNNETYYHYKLDLIKFYKENFPGFPDFSDDDIKAEVLHTINRNCE